MGVWSGCEVCCKMVKVSCKSMCKVVDVKNVSISDQYCVQAFTFPIH